MKNTIRKFFPFSLICLLFSILPYFYSLEVYAAKQKEYEYEVKNNDSLWTIAQTQLGDPYLYHRIYEDNKAIIGEDMNLILPGMRLTLHSQSSKEEETEAIEALLVQYFQARAEGDIKQLTALHDVPLPEKEALMIEYFGAYIDHFQINEFLEIESPELSGIIVGINYDYVFKNIDTPVPGFRSMYIKWDDLTDSFYIDDLTMDETEYHLAADIMAASPQFVEMVKTVNTEYNALLEQNPKLSEYVSEITAEVTKKVSESLAK